MDIAMKRILYAIYGASLRVIRQLIRSFIAVVRILVGQSNTDYEQYSSSERGYRLLVCHNNVVIKADPACQIFGADWPACITWSSLNAGLSSFLR
jgi:hypothetical protein